MKTASILNEWDLLAERFNTNKIKNEVHPDAAVNVYVGWPCFIQQIKYQADYAGKKSLDIFDFGCGGGEFCKALHQLGHKTTGMDSSCNMRKMAKRSVPDNIKILSELEFEESFLENNSERFDVVTSIHVLDWIENVKATIRTLAGLIKKDGILIFSVFPKSHIRDSLAINDLFEDFDSPEDPKVGFANFDGVKVQVYVREPSYYDRLLAEMGFSKIMEFYPPYPKEFLEKYKWTGSLQPEMMILTYRKN